MQKILTGDALYSSMKIFFIFSSESLMNSYGSSFKYFNNFSHKFGDAATDKKNSYLPGVQIMAINTVSLDGFKYFKSPVLEGLKGKGI
jgi:hypothetical protein